MTDNDNKDKLTGKLQLKKTINAGQIKQVFLMGEVDQSQPRLRKKGLLAVFQKMK